MKAKTLRPWLTLPVALALATLACGVGGSSNPPTETPSPVQETAAPKPKPTVTKAAPKPTQAAQETRAAPAPLSLSDKPYDHPSGAFSITLPDGWDVEERDDGLFTSSPDNVASIDVSFVNVGVELTAEELETFINAVEANWFGSFQDYQEESREPQDDGSLGILKTLKLNDGTEQTVFSYYELRGTVVYEQDYWVNSDEFDAYESGLVDMANTMTIDETAGAEAPMYNSTYTFTGPENLFEMRVPYSWTYATDSSDTAIVDTFTSPDGLSQIENIAYDDGTEVSKSQAGAVALALLKEYYEVNDIKVTGDEVQADGSERLTWNSASKGWDGVSFFETRGTTFLLLTWIVDADSYDLYEPVWSATVESYTTPE